MKRWFMDDSFTQDVGKELGHAVLKIEIGICIAALILMILK